MVPVRIVELSRSNCMNISSTHPFIVFDETGVVQDIIRIPDLLLDVISLKQIDALM